MSKGSLFRASEALRHSKKAWCGKVTRFFERLAIEEELEGEIAKQHRKIEGCKKNERSLVALYGYGEIDENYILLRLPLLRKQREKSKVGDSAPN